MIRKEFYDNVRNDLFGGSLTQTAVDNMRLIIETCLAEDVTDFRDIAYVLSTTLGEVGRKFEPVREGFKSTDEAAKRHVQRVIKKRYADKHPETGQSYFGRGFVQLTWYDNYVKAGQKLDLDLVNNPGLALEPETAARILVVGMRDGWFTGRRLSHYINSNKTDYVNARRIVNGTDKADKFASFARGFHQALKLAYPEGHIPMETKPTLLSTIGNRISFIVSGMTLGWLGKDATTEAADPVVTLVTDVVSKVLHGDFNGALMVGLSAGLIAIRNKWPFIGRIITAIRGTR